VEHRELGRRLRSLHRRYRLICLIVTLSSAEWLPSPPRFFCAKQ
jgi:hypothetical protein